LLTETLGRRGIGPSPLSCAALSHLATEGIAMEIARRLATAAVVCLGLCSASAPALATDITGIWVGEQVCQYFDGTATNPRFTDDFLLITQQGDNFFLFTPLAGLFQAQAIDDLRSPATKAQAIFIHCDTTVTSDFQELGRAKKLETNSNPTSVAGTFEATSNFFETAPDGFRFMGTCQWTYRRVSTEDPDVPDCASVMSQATVKGGLFTRRPRP
jgi:hypothetical protein